MKRIQNLVIFVLIFVIVDSCDLTSTPGWEPSKQVVTPLVPRSWCGCEAFQGFGWEESYGKKPWNTMEHLNICME